MGKRGPQPVKINWDEFEKLVSYQCTQLEIAHFFGIDVETLSSACERELGEKLSAIWSKKKSLGRVRIRKAQFEIMEKGGPGAATMAIYLDKKTMPEERFDLPDRPPPQANGLVLETQTKTSPVPLGFTEFCERARYHKPMEKQLEMRAFAFEESSPRMLLGARGYGKTDYVTVMGTAYEIYLDWFNAVLSGAERPKFTETNLIITKSKTRNTALIEEIAAALQANGVPLEKSNASCLRVEGLVGKDHSVEALSIRSALRGRHPVRVLMDDPVTEEDVSKATRLMVKRKYNEILKLTSNVLLIGQPAHMHDLYMELRSQLKKREYAHGEIPELDHDLEAQRAAGVDEKSIQASYFLQIISDGTMPFEKVKYIDRFPERDSVAFLDPSDGGDYTALSSMHAHFDGMAVTGRVWKKAWYHALDEIEAELLKRRVKRLCFETNATGTQPIEQLQARLGPKGIGVVGVASSTEKHSTIMAAGAYASLIHLSRDSDRLYTEQVVQYEYGAEFDDAPDSLARCLAWLGLIRGKR